MSEDVEMKDQTTPSHSISSALPSTLHHLKEISSIIETGSYSKEVRRIARAVRLTFALRRRLTAPLLSSFLDYVLVPASELHAKFSSYLPSPKEGDREMEADSATSSTQNPVAKHLLPELEIYCYLLVLLFLIDQKRPKLVPQLALFG